MPGLLDDYNYSRNYINAQMESAAKMGYLGDALRNPNSSENQFILRNLASQFNASQPNYFEIAASQGRGGSIAALQKAAANRQAGLLTNANFGNLMNENTRTALGYYGQGSQASQSALQAQTGLLNLGYQDKWREDELEERKREYEDSKGSFWDDLVNIGMGVAGSFAGGLGSRLGKKWFS